jgi:hypothetical protein
MNKLAILACLATAAYSKGVEMVFPTAANSGVSSCTTTSPSCSSGFTECVETTLTGTASSVSSCNWTFWGYNSKAPEWQFSWTAISGMGYGYYSTWTEAASACTGFETTSTTGVTVTSGVSNAMSTADCAYNILLVTDATSADPITFWVEWNSAASTAASFALVGLSALLF